MQLLPGIINSELRYPTKTSKKKKRYITYQCKTCKKIVEQVYASSRYRQLCSRCVQHTMTTADFIKKGTELHNHKFDYSMTSFQGLLKQVVIRCPIHGEFSQRAAEHLDGHGCNQCAIDQRKETYLLPKQIWINRMAKYPLISFKDESQIRNYDGYVDLICQIHGEFTIALGQVGKATYLCTACTYTAHQMQSIRPEFIGIPTTLYYVYLPKIDMYKFGVTVDLKARLRQLGETKLLATGIKEYTEAIRLEHKVFKALDKYRYKGKKVLIKNGSTELFKVNVIKQIKRALRE